MHNKKTATPEKNHESIEGDVEASPKCRGGTVPPKLSAPRLADIGGEKKKKRLATTRETSVLPESQRLSSRGDRVRLVKLLDVVAAGGAPAELCPAVRAREGILHVHAEVLLEQRPRFEHL